ncbi:MAG: calcium/sodium antiporter [Thermoplasmata archaeon]|nr:calcium/sodium antiporter [Thermoplasmata archaeon]
MSLLPVLHGLGVLLGLYLLIKGSDWFVEGAASLALKRGVSQHLIGFTLVAFATSLPELATTVASRTAGEADLPVGNILGSNIANIGLVLGAAALFLPIKSNPEVRRDAVFMLFTTLLLGGVLYFLKVLNIVIGAIFLSIYTVYLYYLRRGMMGDEEDRKIVKGPIKKEIILLIIGFVALSLGAEVLVKYSIALALDLRVATGVIGLTIVAVGTSFPELATSLTAALKKNEGLAIGNVLGSNIINLLLILGVLGTSYGVKGTPVASYMIGVILPILLGITLIEFLFSFKTQGRPHGVVLLSVYILFLYFLFH